MSLGLGGAFMRSHETTIGLDVSHAQSCEAIGKHPPSPLRLWAALSAFLAVFATGQAPAQEPACAAVPEATRSCVDLIIVNPALGNQGRTGASSFGTDNEPGNDASATNHVIRTLDTLTYELRYRVLHRSATNTAITVTLPAGVSFADAPNVVFANAPIPTFCGAGSTIVAQTLTCRLGTVVDGTARNVVVRARPEFTVPDGTVLLPQATITASNEQSTGPVARTGYQDPLTEVNLSCSETRLNTTVTLFPCGDIVSAAPKFDLELAAYATTNIADRGARNPHRKSIALASSLTTVVGGPAGRAGFINTYAFAIALPGEGIGSAPITSLDPIVLTQQLSNSDGIANFGELVGCGVNGNDDPVPNGTRLPANWSLGATQPLSMRALFHPFGKIGLAGSTATNSVVDSGTLACTQSVAGGDISIALTPTAQTFNPATFPTHQVDGNTLARKYVAVGLLVVFYPAAPVITPADGGFGDGSVTVRHNLGVLTQGQLVALNVGGAQEPDAVAINNGFAGVQTFDDDTNNFSISTMDSGGQFFRKGWRNPRLDTATYSGVACLRDGSDPFCRHGYVFPGTNIQSELFFDNSGIATRSNAQLCDEWDSARTQLRLPYDPLANAAEMPPGSAMILGLSGLNANVGTLNAAGFTVEVSTDAGTIANIDWDANEPARTLARSQASAPECSSGTWTAATLPASLAPGWNAISLPPALESPVGSGRYPNVKRVRVRAASFPPYMQAAFRGSYEVLSTIPGTKLPNRTSFRFGTDTLWTYAENDHAIVRTTDTSIQISASRNLTTGALPPLATIAFGDVMEFSIFANFNSGDANAPPSTFPLVIKAFLPNTVDFIAGTATPPLAISPYAGVDPESGTPATVLEWRLTNLVPGQYVPALTYAARLNFNAPNNGAIHTSATVEHALDPSPLFITPIWYSLEDRLAYVDLVANVPEGLLVSKTTTTPFVEMNGTIEWQLHYRNTSGTAFPLIRLIDVLPANGDSVNTGNAFSGSFSGAQISPTLPGEYTIYYSTAAPSTINRNPNCVSNGGTLVDGTGLCPAVGTAWTPTANGQLPASATAVRIDDSNGLGPNSLQSVTLAQTTQGNTSGDVYENSFDAVAVGQSLVVTSTKTQVRIPSAHIRGAVYADHDNSSTPTLGDAGIANVAITLSGSDTNGNLYAVSTATVAASTSTTTNVVRINNGASTTITCTPDAQLNVGEYLFCNLPTSDANGYTVHETQPIDYLDRADNLGSLSSGSPAGSNSANDTFSGIRLTNNLSTGAGDRGTGYNFGEYALFANVAGRVYREGSTPRNLYDDEPPEDPGLVTQVSIACTPSYAGAATQATNADGAYLFSRVPVGASCTVTETQPQGYGNAYNQRGNGAFADTGTTGIGNSTIALVVPVVGSYGNNFAENQMTDTTSVIACLPANPVAGAPVVCTATCTNHGPAEALAMTCSIANLASIANAQTTGCATSAIVAVGATLTCAVQFPMPLTGGQTVIAGSGSNNDINGGTVATAGNNPSTAALGTLNARDPALVPIRAAAPLIALLLLMMGAWQIRLARTRQRERS